MLILVTGLVLFFGMHSISIVNAAARDNIANKIGVWPWKGLYTLVALPGIVLMVWGFGLARQDPVVLYAPPDWMAHVTQLLMILVFPLFLSAYLPGRIKTAVKHPMLAATKIWAFAHLLANGTLGDVLLFGSFLVWAVADRISYKHRAERPILTAPATPVNDGLAVVGGLVIYVVFIFWGHRMLIGVGVG